MMSKYTKENFEGRRFGRLIMLEFAYKTSKNQPHWKCLCDCGVTKNVRFYDLVNGKIKSCGCLRVENSKRNNTTHGYANKISEYSTWQLMSSRCNNIKNNAYFNYGGRGIKISKRWEKFENFLKDMGRKPSKKHSIDRINNNKGYCKSNCRWDTVEQQNRNKRNTFYITFNGKTQCLATWADELKMNYMTLYDRFNKLGWSIKKSFHTSVSTANNRKDNINITFRGETFCLTRWSRKLKINKQTLWSRIFTSNWSIEKAFTTPVSVSNNKKNNVNITFNGKTQCLNRWAKELNINCRTLRYRISTKKWSIEKAFATPIRKNKHEPV